MMELKILFRNHKHVVGLLNFEINRAGNIFDTRGMFNDNSSG